MDTAAFDYLMRLAALSIAFVGFATIVVTLRRALGGDLSPFYVLLVRIYVEIGLVVTLGSVLPSLLNLFGLPGTVIWRVCSALAGIVAPVFLIDFMRRRNRADHNPVYGRIFVRYTISALAIIGLWLNVAGVPIPPSGGPYALALTWFLVSAGLVFIQTFDEVLYGKPIGKQTTVDTANQETLRREKESVS
jgi:hypothetical protein